MMLRSRLFLNNNIKEKIIIRLKTDKPSNQNALLNKKIYVNDSTKETAYVWNGKDIELNYDSNINISITVDDIRQFITPNRVSFITKKGNTRILDFNYIKPDYGVYIMNTNEGLYEAANWENASIRNDLGIYVITKERRILIASSLGYNLWSKYVRIIPGITTTTDKNIAITDYFGRNNTFGIINALGDAAFAASCCNNYVFKNGFVGYLPAMGELVILFNKKYEILDCMKVLNGNDYEIGDTFLSSTQYDAKYCWGYYFGSPREIYKGDPWWFFIAAEYE